MSEEEKPCQRGGQTKKELLRMVKELGLEAAVLEEEFEPLFKGMPPTPLTIERDDEGNYHVEMHIFLLGKPEWEIGREQWKEATVEKLVEILPKMGRDIYERLTTVTNRLKALKREGYGEHVSTIAYGIAIGLVSRSPEEAVKEAENLFSILSREAKAEKVSQV